MPKLLIIADDFTGALDTCVQFSSCGAKTKVINDSNCVFSRAGGLDVLVFDSETRHLSAGKSYKIINKFVKRYASKFSYASKKTDSGLRGNIGLDASNLNETQKTEEFIKSHNLNTNQLRIRIPHAIRRDGKNYIL